MYELLVLDYQIDTYHILFYRCCCNYTVYLYRVFQVSYHQLRRSTVRVETGPGASPPPVQKLFSRVGYGEDRHGGHTVTLLRTVNSRVGPVSSFTGTYMADRWTVDLNTL